MPDIKPFRGILYDGGRVDFNDVVAPPYDVISPEQQASLYKRHLNNVVRLILNNEEDPYGGASRKYREWREHSILRQDDVPSLYVLAQSFSDADGKLIERWGCIAACRLEEIGKGSIYPHEKTLSGPREDRLRLFQSTNAMFSQIFSLYNDPRGILDAPTRSVISAAPAVDVVFEGVRNRLWRLDDERHRNTIVSYLADEKVLIADGHHRYETALAYRNSRRLKNPDHTGKEPYNFVPMFFTNMQDPGLIIYPTHRLVHSLPSFNPVKLLAEAEKYFVVTESSSPDAFLGELRSIRKGGLGLALGSPNRFVVLRAREAVSRAATEHLPAVLADLDVTLLHTIILKNILGMSDEAQEKKLFLKYEKETQRAISAAGAGEAQAAFIMNPTRIEQVKAVAASGMVMPQKSTFFYPKILSGLVLYSFDNPA